MLFFFFNVVCSCWHNECIFLQVFLEQPFIYDLDIMLPSGGIAIVLTLSRWIGDRTVAVTWFLTQAIPRRITSVAS